MENKTNFDDLLKQQMLADASEIKAPPLWVFNELRKQVQKRAAPTREMEDLISIVANFLNVKIKLYQAALVFMIVACCILYFGKYAKNHEHQVPASTYVSSIAAVNNSTVLSSINTCVTRK